MPDNLHFELSTYAVEESAFPKPDENNYDYWSPLIGYFFEKSDNIEIHCWNAEAYIIEEMKSIFYLLEISYEYKLTYFKGNLTSEVKNFIQNHAMNENGEFKWFSIFLLKESKTIFHSEHWATEFFAPDVSEQDIKHIHKAVPANTNFNQYKD